MNLREIKREFLDVPIGRIDEPELPSRSSMDDDLMSELVNSIKIIGLQQPMVLARVGDRFEVIAGHRRRIACERAGLVSAPAIVYPSKDAGQEAIKYAENRHREELNPADEAIWFAELLERDCGNDTNRLAERLGEKRHYVEGRLLLFSGDTEIFEALRAGKIKIGVAHELNKCSDQLMRRYYLDCAIRGGATIAVVVGWIQQWRESLGPRGEDGSVSTPASPPGAVPQTDYFRCYVCGKSHNVHLMQPINVHHSCRDAILDPLLGREPVAASDVPPDPDPRRI